MIIFLSVKKTKKIEEFIQKMKVGHNLVGETVLEQEAVSVIAKV